MNDIPDINILLRYASGVITDYSSIYLDYMKLMRPVLLYTPDLRKYERQYNYKFEEFSPHEEVNNFEMFINKFKDILEGTYNIDEKYYGVVKRFHKFDLDNKNSTRLLNCLKLLPEGNE
jgi:CDP-glycerol glycerophosphotransferase (TagB/SpsB family)